MLLNLRFLHNRDCYVFGNSLFREHDTDFPRQNHVVEVLSNGSTLNRPQIMELIERMETNTPYSVDIDSTIEVLTELESCGFHISHTIVGEA